jgi:hypothetical protein
MSVSILITALNTSSDYAFDIFKIYSYHVCQFKDDKVSMYNIQANLPMWSSLLSSHLC